jgi:hypothetical protein
MDAEEFGWWAAVYQRDPWGEERADFRNAMLMSLIAGALSSGKTRYKPADFMPKFGRRPVPKQESPEAIWAKFKHIVDMTGARVVSRGG